MPDTHDSGPSIEKLMTSKVVSVGPASPVKDVLQKLHAYRISCVVVCDGKTPVGIISERDVVGLAFDLASGRAGTHETAADLMSSEVKTIHRLDSLEDAARLASRERIRHLPVVDDDGHLVGLLTQSDLLRATFR